MEVQVAVLLTQHQWNVAEMLADLLVYLPKEDRRAVMEVALAEADEE